MSQTKSVIDHHVRRFKAEQAWLEDKPRYEHIHQNNKDKGDGHIDGVTGQHLDVTNDKPAGQKLYQMYTNRGLRYDQMVCAVSRVSNPKDRIDTPKFKEGVIGNEMVDQKTNIGVYSEENDDGEIETYIDPSVVMNFKDREELRKFLFDHKQSSGLWIESSGKAWLIYVDPNEPDKPLN